MLGDTTIRRRNFQLKQLVDQLWQGDFAKIPTINKLEHPGYYPFKKEWEAARIEAREEAAYHYRQVPPIDWQTFGF